MSNSSSVSSASMAGRSGLWHRGQTARRLVMALLQKLEGGGLTLHENGELFQYGKHSELCAEIRILDPRAYQYILSGGTVGAGEAYMLGYWSSPDLVSVVRLFSRNVAAMNAMDQAASKLRRWTARLGLWRSRNTHDGSRRNIRAHYDLGNDFFRLFLDPSMMYSAAVYPTREASLEEAAQYKLDLLCRQLELSPYDHLLEIGTGWGGLAIYAARHYGCRVTTTTISREQFEYSARQIREAGLEDRITLLNRDYRELEGQFDKLVSVEMIEAVGHQYYAEYFQRCSELLAPGGKMALQAITIADQRYHQARNSADFIKQYIFPGGCLPSVEVIAHHVARDSDLQIVSLNDITADYARTLRDWRARFLNAHNEVRAMGFDDVFERMWEFYLCYCEGGFMERIISTVQLTLAKPGYRFER